MFRDKKKGKNSNIKFGEHFMMTIKENCLDFSQDLFKVFVDNEFIIRYLISIYEFIQPPIEWSSINLFILFPRL